MPTSTRVMIPIEQEWSRVSTAAVEVDRHSGIKMLRIDLAAMAPKVYVPLEDIHVLEQGVLPPAAQDALERQEVGHA